MSFEQKSLPGVRRFVPLSMVEWLPTKKRRQGAALQGEICFIQEHQFSGGAVRKSPGHVVHIPAWPMDKNQRASRSPPIVL